MLPPNITLVINDIAPITYVIIAAIVMFFIIVFMLAHWLNSSLVILVVPKFIFPDISYCW